MRTLALALVLLATPAAAQDALAPAAAEAAVRAFLADPSGPVVSAARAGNVSVAGGTVTLDALELEFALPDGDGGTTRATLTAPVALVDGLARTSTGWRAAAIRLPEARVAVDANADGADTGRIELIGPSWPAAVAKPATDGPAAAFEPLLSFLAALSADGAMLESPEGSVTVGEVEDGRVATLEASIKGGSGDAAKPVRIALEGFDIGAVTDVMFANGGPAQVALGKLRVSDVWSGFTPDAGDAAAASTTLTDVGSFSIEGIRLTPQSPPLAARIDDLAAITKAAGDVLPADPALAPGAAPKPPSPEEVDLALAVWSAIGIDLMSLEGLRTRQHDADETFTVDRIAVAEIGAGRDADVSMDGMTFDLPEGEKVTVARIALLGLKIPDQRFMRAAILAGDAPPSPDVIIGNLPIVRRIALEQLAGESKEGVSFAIDEVSVEMSGHINNIPTELTSTTRGAIDLNDAMMPEDPSGAAMIAELRARGLSRITFAGGDHFAWKDGGLAYAGRMELAELGSYALDLTMSGIPRYVFEDPSRIAEIVAFLSLDDFRLQLADHGAVPMLRDLIARERQGDVDAELDAALGQIEAEVGTSLGAENARIVREALETFAGGGHSITLAGTPQRPVPFTQLGVAALAPRAIVDLLGLKLTVAPSAN